MSKRVWLINQYTMPPEYEARIQTLKRAENLISRGYEVTIFSGSFMHNINKSIPIPSGRYKAAVYEGLSFVHVKMPSYNGTVGRLWSSVVFNVNLVRITKTFKKPDVVCKVATVPFSNIFVASAKKWKSLLVVDVLDLWPESFVSYGLLPKTHPIISLAYRLEYWLYRKADRLIFSMEGGIDYVRDKGWDEEAGGSIGLSKVFHINNGVDICKFDFDKQTYIYTDFDLDNTSMKSLVYLGSMRLVNDVKLIIDAARYLSRHKNIQILLFGNGDQREYLERYVKANGISNVIFKEKRVDIKLVPSILSKAYINILNYKPNDIVRYGGSQSKMFQYMASGKPILSNIDWGYSPIKKYHLGISINIVDPKHYSECMLSLIELPRQDYLEMCKRSRRVAEKFDYSLLSEKFIKMIE